MECNELKTVPSLASAYMQINCFLLFAKVGIATHAHYSGNVPILANQIAVTLFSLLLIGG